MNINFGANKTLVKIIKKGALGGIYSSINDKWYNRIAFEKSWKEYWSNYDDVSVKCRTSLRFWKIKSSIDSIDTYDWF